MKNLQELTIKDNFMFGAVMLEEKNFREQKILLYFFNPLPGKRKLNTG